MHVCISKTTIIDSDNGLSPGRCQAIIWSNTGILLIGTLGTNISEFLSEINAFSFKKMHLKMSSGKCQPFRLGLNVLNTCLLLNLCMEFHYAHKIILQPNYHNSGYFHRDLYMIIMLIIIPLADIILNWNMLTMNGRLSSVTNISPISTRPWHCSGLGCELLCLQEREYTNFSDIKCWNIKDCQKMHIQVLNIAFIQKNI